MEEKKLERYGEQNRYILKFKGHIDLSDKV